jgi:hypothetical protein
MTVKFEIQSDCDRANIVLKLANAGYKVWIEKEEVRDVTNHGTIYWVCADVPLELIMGMVKNLKTVGRFLPAA